MPRVVEQVFDSPESMAQTAGRLTALPWPDWTARMRWLDVDGVRADYVELDPYELSIPALADRVDRSTRLMLSIILEGTSTGSIDGHAVRLSSRQAALIDGRAAMQFHAPAPVRAMRLFVDEDRLAADALRCPSLPFATLKHTPLVAGCVGLIAGLLQVNSPSIEPHDEVAVSQPLIALMGSLLDQALHSRRSAPGTDVPARTPQGRQEQIEDYIDRHLADPDLTPTSIANALGMNLRTLHASYEHRPETVAAQIRARRVLRAQAILAARDEPPNLAALASRVGLTPTRLTRVFQASTNRTTRQWWEERRSTTRR